MALTLHVGAHKTASTHLQQTLRALIGPMRRAGIHYLDISHLRRGHRLDDALGDGPAPARRRGRWRRHLDAAAETWPEMLISEENILGSVRRAGLMGPEGIYPQAVRRVDRMCASLRRRPAVLYLSVREPLAFLGSAFAMQVEGGFELDFAEYTQGFDPAALSWSGLAERLLDVAGVARLVAWRYEDYPAVRPVLLRSLLPQALAAQAPDPRPALIGLSQEAFDEIRRRAEAEPDEDLRVIAREAKDRFPRAVGEGRITPASPAVRARVAAAHADDLDLLSRIDGVEVLHPGG